MNVTELARQLNLPKEQLFDKIQELGFDIGRRAIKIDDSQAEKIIKAIQEQQKSDSGPTISERLESETETTKEIEKKNFQFRLFLYLFLAQIPL